ncbi:MAG: hypothetical protein ACRDGM_11705 [bacterium]
MDLPIVVSTVDSETVLRAWLNPLPACHAPAPKPVELPDSWTVVSTATGFSSAWAGDMALVADGSYSCELVRVIRFSARTPALRIIGV